MSNAPTRITGIVAQVVEVALGHDPKGADGPKHAALGAVDLVDPAALPNRSALASSRQVEILREDLLPVALITAIAVASSATGPAASITGIASVKVTSRPRIVSVPHG